MQCKTKHEYSYIAKGTFLGMSMIETSYHNYILLLLSRFKYPFTYSNKIDLFSFIYHDLNMKFIKYFN